MTLLTNRCTYAAFHKALQRYSAGEINDFDVVLLYKFIGVYTCYNYFSMNRLDKVTAKMPWCSFFLPQCIMYRLLSTAAENYSRLLNKMATASTRTGVSVRRLCFEPTDSTVYVTKEFVSPSLFMPTSRHLRSRQARHWLRCILSTAHISGLPRDLHSYFRPRRTDR